MKKLKRMLEELFGHDVKSVAFPQSFNGKNWGAFAKHYRNVKPSQRLQYYKDFRFFVKETTVELIHETDLQP